MSRITFAGMSKAERATLISSIAVVRGFLGRVELSLMTSQTITAEEIAAKRAMERPAATVHQLHVDKAPTNVTPRGFLQAKFVALRSGDIDEYASVMKYSSAMTTRATQGKANPDLDISVKRIDDDLATVTYRMKREMAVNE
jgi:hypothetical protein